MYVEMRKYMKKKLFSVLLVGALAASLVACGKTEEKEAKASTANTEINAEEYAGTIEAYTYPDEFAKCNGESEMLKGVTIGQQKRQPFGFAYRTLIGNDTDGTSHGYKIHLVYGALASPSPEEHESANADPNVNPLSWEFSTTPVEVENCEPTATLEIDSTKVTAAQMLKIEEILYGKDATASGNDGVEPRLPLPDEIVTILKAVTE